MLMKRRISFRAALLPCELFDAYRGVQFSDGVVDHVSFILFKLAFLERLLEFLVVFFGLL